MTRKRYDEDLKKQWSQAILDDAVAEIITKLVQNEKFEKAVKDKINSKIDTVELEVNFEKLKKSLNQKERAKTKLAQQMDSLDISDSLYDRKYDDMQDRLYQLYEDIDSIEIEMEEVKARIQNIKLDKLNADSIYNILRLFDQLYDKFTDFEKQEFIKSFVEKVEIYPQELEDGRIIEDIKFRFPVFFNGSEVNEISWDKESTVECCVLMSRTKD